MRQKLAILFCLIFAGEMIFSLPFHIARFFRPTFLSSFELSNTQLGDIFAIYGIVAMLCYFPGGLIADRFSGRRLMTLSLICTAGGGLYMASFPSVNGLRMLFAYWGLTTILMFWAAMIKVTRQIGGQRQQGRAFGALDAGRGLVAAIVASIAVFVLSASLPEDLSLLSLTERKLAIQQVTYFYCAGTFLAALLVWFVVPRTESENSVRKINHDGGLTAMLKRPFFWGIAAVVVCAYCGYKGIDNYALYATQVLSMDEVESARFTSFLAYTRPVVAVLAGILADRFMASRIGAISFAAMLVSYLVLASAEPSTIGVTLLIANLAVSVCGVFAIRAVYFALLHEGNVPEKHTGAAVGIISVIGFTPDIFFAPIAGRILDAAPGIAGHQSYFLFLSAIALAGLICAIALFANIKRSQTVLNKKPKPSHL